MLSKNFRKLVSLASSAAMLAAVAVPTVFADSETGDDKAELNASLNTISSNDFNNASVGDVLVHKTEAQDAYTGFDGLSLYIGSGTAGNENTKISVADGVGVDGSRALVFSGGKAAASNRGPRMTFDIPEKNDSYVIKLKAYPVGSEQDLSINSNTSNSTGLSALKLNNGEWNDIEIHVSRGSNAGTIINVNGVTLSSTTASGTPVIWANTSDDNLGDIYIDDVEVESEVSLPTPIPTATPKPTENLKVGDKVDFEDINLGSFMSLGTSASAAYDKIPGFVFYIGMRASGGDAGTNWSITAGKGVNDSKALVMNCARYASAGRGPRVELVKPDDASNYKVSFMAKRVDSGSVAQDLVAGSSTSTAGGTALGLPNNEWVNVEIMMYNGSRYIMVDGNLVNTSTTSDLPVLWSIESENSGSVYIDNYEISEVTAEDAIKAMAAIISITNTEKTVYENNGMYSFISGFALPDSVVDKDISWSVSESSDDGATWNNTSDIRLSGARVILNSPSEDKQYKLNASISDGTYSAEKNFVLKYVAEDKVIDSIVKDLDITEDNANIKKVSAENGEKYSFNEKDYDTKYRVSGNFKLPLTDWVTNITWNVTDETSIQIDKDGDVKVLPKNTGYVLLTATVSYGGKSVNKEFLLDLANYNNEKQTLVNQELDNAVVYPKGTIGTELPGVTLSDDGSTVISTDVTLKTTSASDAGLAISWKSSDDKVLSEDGVIAVTDKNAHDVELTKTVTYSMNGESVISNSKTYKVKVQFDPDTMTASAEEKAQAYALTKSTDTTSKDYQDAYNNAMEILCDRYKTRGDAAYSANFAGIPASGNTSFDLPTKGAFGSEITWTSSDSSIKINNGKATVTHPKNSVRVTLNASFTSGASSNLNGYSTIVSVSGTGSSSSGGGSGSSSGGGGNSYRGNIGGISSAATPAPDNNGNNNSQDIAPTFGDLGSVTWAQVAINALARKGIVSGRDAVTFAPNDNVTRAEFAKILVGAFGIETGASADLNDVDSSAWYAPYVGACYAAGIITGYDDGSFKPNNNVTRQEMAVMVMRAANVKGMTIEKPYEKINFTDADSIAEYAAEAVDTLQQAGIINGMEDGSFAPAATATRAQAAKILYTFCQD